MNIDGQINRYINYMLNNEGLEECFKCFVVHSSEQEEWKRNMYQENTKMLFTGMTPENKESAVRQYVNSVSVVRSEVLLDQLKYAINAELVPAKLVCDALLSCENLQYTNSDFWCQSFSLIRHALLGVDYKGVRDLLKLILDKSLTIPLTVNVSVLKQLNALQSVVEYILDRNTCLLPSYLILDEIQKKIYPHTQVPHWKLAKSLSSFVDSFKPTAQMVSVIGRSKLLPVVGHSGALANVWKLDSGNAKFLLRGLLPYTKELREPQTNLIKYVLEQPYSRDMVCGMLGLSKQQKQRCPVLEEQLVELIVMAMEKSENETDSMEDGGPTQLLWQHLSSQLIYFVLFQYASFPHMVQSLFNKLMKRNLRKGRDHLMWVLLQFISGSIQKNPLSDFLPVMKLYDLLYPEKEALPLPDVSRPSTTHAFAITSIWIHLMKKAQTEQIKLQRPLPQVLKNHFDYLSQSLVSNDLHMSLGNEYRVSLLCNAYSTNQEYFTRPMAVLVEAVQGNQKGNNPIGNMTPTSSQPLSMSILDSLTVHTKMSLIHNIVTHMMKLAQAKSSLALASVLVETYSRLLVYNETESLGIKGFISQLLPAVFRSQAWGILHTLLEMFSYRLHHIQPHYRVQLLGHLHSLAAVPHTNQTQLHLCMESTALKLITGLGSAEVQPQLSRFQNEPKTLLSSESEELNKALVLTLARAIHITGSETLSITWCKEILTTIMQNTPHNWSSLTLQCFPHPLGDFFQKYQPPRENKAQLKRSVEEEYRKWKTMSNENDIIAHFSLQGTPPLFLCLLWKMLLENDRISPMAYKILDRIGARALSTHLRTFADFLVFEFANSVGGQHLNKCIDALNDLVWRCHVVTLDRLILCLALRSFENNEAQVCFFIIQMVLLKSNEFKNRVYEFIKENSPEHWKQSNWHEKHMAFHRKYPEKFYFEGLQDNISSQSSQHTYLPVYFGNVCLRFIPVLDIVIHRFLELSSGSMSVESLLDQLCCLYKFHDSPVTYLYNTLHYYEQKLKDRPALKRKLVSTIIGSLKDIRPTGWALSEGYQQYLLSPPDDLDWVPDLEYYIKLIGRLVDTLNNKSPFPHTDWRFNEFPNPAAHALHVTCIELMALPVAASTVANNVLDVVLKGHIVLTRSNIEYWMNSIGLVLTALPEPFWSVLHDRILETISNPLLTAPSPTVKYLQIFNFHDSFLTMTETECTYLLGVTHAIWYHATIGQINCISQFVKEKLKPVIKTEEQLLFLCHLVGPFLQRLHAEKTRCVMDLTIELYEILEVVDRNCPELNYIDVICDLLYHIKYMFTGDSVKNEVERCIRNLRPVLQMRLRFITHMTIDEVPTC